MSATEIDTTWRSRIVGHGEAVPSELVANPANWRVHPPRQRKALEALLDQVGWVRNVIVNRVTGHLVALAVTRKEATIPVVYVELDEDEERLVLASLDPIASLAATDTAALAALAANFEVTDVATEQPELTEMVREMSGTKSQSTDSQSPSQDQIDARADEIEHAFEDRHLKSYEATCPNCGNGFSFAR
jgi:hypothetical protein